MFSVRDLFRSSGSSSPAALLICLILSAHTTPGQSLSIKQVDSKYWIEASAPTDNPGALQASENLHLWVNIHENIQEPQSFPLDGVSERYFRLIPSPPPAPPIRVMVLGDSLASECCGWGRGLPTYFTPSATIVNYAQPWQSTKVFLRSAEYNNMLLIKPDYVLIQFTWIDQSAEGTTPQEFTNNLRTIVQTVREFNGIPILITMHAMRTWDAQGRLIPSDQAYNPLIRQVAAELNTPLIDLYQTTARLLTELGPSAADFMRWEEAPNDSIHLSQLGGVYVSRLLTHFLPKTLGPYVTGILDPPPNP